ncbi:hypothetical protein GWK47_012018 [Chionoecetes opilio]|uniref:Uncharacterized protein n=1 Tax=Chionoecetes opilio TaxID=41210 RepID=A0A8J5C294_CHIOP|nr:hypothetical protein GWK47_012018 [Chionoecetes opilio]
MRASSGVVLRSGAVKKELVDPRPDKYGLRTNSGAYSVPSTLPFRPPKLTARPIAAASTPADSFVWSFGDYSPRVINNEEDGHEYVDGVDDKIFFTSHLGRERTSSPFTRLSAVSRGG